MQRQIAFIGAGNMAASLIGGLLRAGTPAGSIVAADPAPEQRQRLAASGIATTADNVAAINDANVIVLAVKPQVMRTVVRNLRDHLDHRPLLISIAAGVTTASIATWSRADAPIVRCMPNTPALYGAGITALFANDRVEPGQRALARDILAAAGEVLWVEAEAQLDAVTAVSGSGPAYFFYLMEAMVQAGTRLGLAPDVAARLTVSTAYGAAVMARETGTDPAGLRRNVTSPGGTTERAIAVLDDASVQHAFREAIEQAAIRSRELAEQFGKQ
jgi:pyrroline-5-carboxylate reductase